MPCVCQGECRKIFTRGARKPYEAGTRFCRRCKLFVEPLNDNKCYCCGGLLRANSKSKIAKMNKGL